MAAGQSLSQMELGCIGVVCTDLGWKQQSDNQSVWPDPVRSTLPFGRPTIFQRRSSLQETRMSLQGCMTILHTEREREKRALWMDESKQFPDVNRETSIITPFQLGRLTESQKQTLYSSSNPKTSLSIVNLINSLDLRVLIYEMKSLFWVILRV